MSPLLHTYRRLRAHQLATYSMPLKAHRRENTVSPGWLKFDERDHNSTGGGAAPGNHALAAFNSARLFARRTKR